MDDAPGARPLPGTASSLAESDLLLREFSHRTGGELAGVAAALRLARISRTRFAGERLVDGAIARLAFFADQHMILSAPIRGEVDVGVELAAICRAVCLARPEAGGSVVRLDVPSIRVPGRLARRLGLIASELVVDAVRQALVGRAGRLHAVSDAEKLVAFNRAPKSGRDDGRHRHDNGAYYRFGSREHNLQTEAIFCGDRMMAALEGAPPAVTGVFTHIRAGALRADKGGCGFTMYGIHRARGFERDEVFYFNKGDRDEPTLKRRLEGALRRALVDYVSGDRLRYDARGRDWGAWTDISRRARKGDREAEATLRRERVWLIGHDRPLTYPNLTQTYTKPRFELAGIEQTLHKLRHERVYFRLREIEAMDVPEREKRRMRDRLAKDMGWTSQAMFRVYDAYEEELRRLADQVAYQERLELGVGVALRRALADGSTERPQMLPLVEHESVGRRFFFSIGAARAA